MIFESTSGKSDKKHHKSFNKNIKKNRVKITHKVMFVLAIATSIDALAAGFSLTVLDVNSLAAFAVIGLTTLVFSGVGVFVGAKSDTWLETKAELFGGIVLVFIRFNLAA